jgi:hypothetical protein
MGRFGLETSIKEFELEFIGRYVKISPSLKVRF